MTKGFNAGGRFTASHDVATANVPGSQILQGSASLVFEFDPARSAGSHVQSGMAADARLNAGLLVRADDVIVGAKGFIAPKPRIKIEDDLGLLGKMRVSREH